MQNYGYSISIIVPTFNEECHIQRCLQSVKWAQHRFVVDAFSHDHTVALARACGATVVQHEWAGYSAQKNWALNNLPLTTEWVLFLDADEWVSTDLGNELRETLDRSKGINGYYLSRRMIFLNRWLKHSWWYPDRTLRLFRIGCGKFDSRAVHERIILEGKAGYLKNDLIHENVKNLHEYIDRHNLYSTLEARDMWRSKMEEISGDFQASFLGDWGQRRRALKDHIWYHLPCRPLIRFLWLYVLRRGFLDGRAGLIFAILASIQEFHIDTKYYELKLRQRRV